MMSNMQFQQLMNKLDTLIKMEVINAFQNKPIAEVALLLSDFGFQNKEIASMLGTTAAYVNKVKCEAKKGAGERRTKQKGRKREKITIERSRIRK